MTIKNNESANLNHQLQIETINAVRNHVIIAIIILNLVMYSFVMANMDGYRRNPRVEIRLRRTIKFMKSNE